MIHYYCSVLSFLISCVVVVVVVIYSFLGWSNDRLSHAMRDFLQEGMAWIDYGADGRGPREYWFIALCKG